MNCANILGLSDHSGRLQRPKPKYPPQYKVGLSYVLNIFDEQCAITAYTSNCFIEMYHLLKV